MEAKPIWEKIMKSDILLRENRRSLFKYLDRTKTLAYFTQTNEGYFDKPSPIIYSTYYCGGILNYLQKRPSLKTIRYIRSLQVGSIGFAETTGEMAWPDKSSMGAELCTWFDIDIEKKNEMIKYFKSFQHSDGGFGSIMCADSNFADTIHTITVLKELGAAPEDCEAAAGWLKSQEYDGLFPLFHLVRLVNILGKLFSENERVKLIWKVNQYKGSDYQASYYRDYVLKYFGHPLQEFGEPKICAEPKDNYFLAMCLTLRGMRRFESELERYVDNYELQQGGYPKQSQSVICNGFMIQSLNLLGSLNILDKSKFISWLRRAAVHDGWGARPGVPEYHEYTVTSLVSLYLLGCDVPKERFVQPALLQIENALLYKGNNNYYVLRTIKNSLEKMMLLGVQPPSLLRICNRIMAYRCQQGGFGSNKPYLYATFWAIRALYLSEQYMTLSQGLFISKLAKIKAKTGGWIKACQNSDGGFGPMPGEPSNIQSTFCAHYCLWMLDEKPNNAKKAIRWLLSLQKGDGGFAARSEMESEMLHILYAIGSLTILVDEH